MRVEAGVAQLEGDLILANTTRLLAEAEAAVAAGAAAFDLKGVGQMDSSAISLLLALKRRAVAANRPVAFLHIPESMLSLAKLYGIAEYL